MSRANARIGGVWQLGKRGGVAPRVVPLMGRSGLSWNSGVYRSNGSATGVTQFEAFRNRQVDTILFFATRQQWTDFNYLPTDRRDFAGLRIISIPPLPEAAGTNLANVAAGLHNDKWQAYGALLNTNGWNSSRTVIRLGWENNGNWYQWAQNQPDPATFVAAFQNVVTSIRQSAPNVLFNWCVNKGPSQSGTGAASSGYPGDAYVDIIGLDHYDHYPPQIDDNSWNAATNQVPGLTSLGQFVRDHGKLLSLDEWGVSHYPGGNGGNDNPFFINKMWTWLSNNADIMAYESYYDDTGAPSTLMHDLSQGRNPNAATAYLSHWGG